MTGIKLSKVYTYQSCSKAAHSTSQAYKWEEFPENES